MIMTTPMNRTRTGKVMKTGDATEMTVTTKQTSGERRRPHPDSYRRVVACQSPRKTGWHWQNRAAL
jgi:hypothetical protein